MNAFCCSRICQILWWNCVWLSHKKCTSRRPKVWRIEKTYWKWWKPMSLWVTTRSCSILWIQNNSISLSSSKKDISGIELNDLQTERCARISANDLVKLITESPDKVVVIDIRNSMEFKRAHVKDSINIPFVSVKLNDKCLDALNMPDLEKRLLNRTVVVASSIHQNGVLVRRLIMIFCFVKHYTNSNIFSSIQFSLYLLECGVARVCALHNGFDILHSFVPNVLISAWLNEEEEVNKERYWIIKLWLTFVPIHFFLLKKGESD